MPKMNMTDLANRTFVYNFYSIHFSVGRVLIIASSSEKKRPKFSMRSQVSGFHGTKNEPNRVCKFKVFLQLSFSLFFWRTSFDVSKSFWTKNVQCSLEVKS